MMSVNGFAFVVMSSATVIACSLAYWAGKHSTATTQK
jgi:hypothetical protein